MRFSSNKKRIFVSTFVLATVFLSSLVNVTETSAAVVTSNYSNLGIITGFVRDEGGKPIADATVAVFKAGTSKLLRQVRSTANGKFVLRVIPGTYTVLAVAQGYNPVTLSDIELARAAQLNYGFKLEKAGSGNTLPEKRLDRNNPKWVRRAASVSRSIYQNTEGDVEQTALAATEEIEELENNGPRLRPGNSVAETFVTSNDHGMIAGLNYATLISLSEDADLLIAAQTSVGPNAPQRIEAQTKFRLNDDHRIRLKTSIAHLGNISINGGETMLGQISAQALDEWNVREGIVFVYGFDYSQFLGAGSDFSITPRLGLQYDIDSKTRFRSSYTSQTDPRTWTREIELEDAEISFREPVAIDDIAIENGKARLNRSTRFEFGIERVLDNSSSIEANAFFDTTLGRGVGITRLPFESAGEEFNDLIGNQSGGAQGVRLVYSRRISGRLSAGGGYSFGSGQQLSANGFDDPAELFQTSVFHSLFGQIEADFKTGTNVKTVFRFSPQATIFAIDPFQGRLAIYDPGLSVLVTQNLPTLGLPFNAQAIIDARNLFDLQTGVAGEAGGLRLNSHRRALRGGILVRF